MSILEALILGLVQGLTEFIPVSSSGHLILAQEVFGNEGSTLAFDVALHVGTLIALLLFFRKDLWSLAINLFSKNKEGRLARLLILSTIPAAVTGLLFSGFIDDNLRSPWVVAFTLSFVGVLMLIADKISKDKKVSEISTKKGIGIGFAQAAALIPGVSRSGATITAGIFSGLGRVQATRFSFLLAVPIIAGSALGIFLKDGDTITYDGALLVGILASFVSGFIAIKFMLGIIGKVGLKPFAYYRIALAAITVVFLLV
jgi:undecaprenyl-diphosphatase